MGTWALEFDPGATGEGYEMVMFNGDVFAFVYSGSGSGVWRRTPPNWTRTKSSAPGTAGRGAVWDGLMWWAGPSNEVHYSPDGVNWFLDEDWGGGAYSHWSAMGHNDDYLYVGQRAYHAIAGTTFFRRDRAANWIEYPPNLAAEVNDGVDIVEYGDYIYFSAGGSDVYRYSIAAGWENEPTLDNEFRVWFCIDRNDRLFASGGNGEIWQLVSGAWVSEQNLGAPWGAGHICVGADGSLWMTVNDGANSRVYFRTVGGTWVLHSTAADEFESVMLDDDGNLFATTRSCEFWVYTMEYGAGVGSGLPNQAMDCDGDGDRIYVCVYDGGGNPVLVRANLPLTQAAIGQGVFAPGAGDAINVKCCTVGQKLAVAGSFGANDQVEVSEDRGATWTDVDPGTWGNERGQPLLIDPDGIEEVFVALETAEDLIETQDEGVSWTQRNAAVGYSPGALAKLPDGDEVVSGDDAANLIEYSPNRGAELHDITGAFVGFVAALAVA